MTAQPSACPSCGAPLPVDSPQGLCPQCLLKGVLMQNETTLDLSEDGQPPPASLAGAAGATASPVRLRYFGDYELIDEIARGGMGVVYRARQVSLNRVVAVKMILSGQLASETEVNRFRIEAEAAANLQHPNIVAIHEIGQHDGRHYFSMDFIAGKNLAEHLLAQSQPLPVRESARLVKCLAEAVHYAHQRGTLHRDLKPQNVLIDAQGRPHITDFGLAKRWEAPAATAAAGVTAGSTPTTAGAVPEPANEAATHRAGSGSSDLSRTGAIMGSPSYMAPEQAAGRPGEIGPATDVYALGAILYQLLTGQPPHRGNTAMETVLKVVADDPAAPREHRADVPADLETICLKCLEKRPERRYPTAAMLAEELDRFLRHEPIFARPAGALRKAASWGLRNPWAIAGLASAFVLGLMILTYGLWEKTRHLAWLSAQPASAPRPTLQAIMKAEVADWMFLTWGGWGFLVAIIWADFILRRRGGAEIGSGRLAMYAFAIAASFGLQVYVLAKFIKIIVWADVPLVVMPILLFSLMAGSMGAIQLALQWIRELRLRLTGVVVEPGLLGVGMQPLQLPGGRFSYWRAQQASFAIELERIKTADTLRRDGPIFLGFVVVAIAAFLLPVTLKPVWLIGAELGLFVAVGGAGIVNPRWVTAHRMKDRATVFLARFAATLIVAFSLAFVLACTVLPPEATQILFRAFALGIVAGAIVVLWLIRQERVDRARPTADTPQPAAARVP